jgi:hypothetical protein
MAYLNTLRAGIQQGSIIQASHVTELYDALSGTGSLGISVIGSSAIGTATPVAGAMLTINGEQRLFGNLVFGEDDTEYFIKPVTAGGAIRFRGDGNASADRALQFGHIDNIGNWTSRMTLKEGGFLGIGTTDPTQKLHVAGGSVIANNYLYNGVSGALAQVAYSSYLDYPNGIPISTSSFTDICYVQGNATSLTRFTLLGGGGDSVISVIADVIVNHQKDVYVQTQGGAYDELQLRIKPLASGSTPDGQTNGEYVLQAKQENGAPSTIYNFLKVTAITEPGSSILFSGSFNGAAFNYSRHEHNHICYPGMHISSTDGDNYSTEGMFGVSRRISIGATSLADHLDSRSWTMYVVGSGSNSLMLLTGSAEGNRRFHIDPKGQVGIGSDPYTAPGCHTLTVGANQPYGVGLIKLRSQYNSGNGAEIFQNPENGTVILNLNSTTSALYIATSSAGGAGRLGIGTSEPTEVLHVAGNVKVDGTLTANNIFSAQSQSLTGDIVFGAATEAGSPNSNIIRGISVGGAIRLVRDNDTTPTINTSLDQLRSLQLGMSDNAGAFNPVMTITNESSIPVHINQKVVIGAASNNTSSIHALVVTGSGLGISADNYYFNGVANASAQAVFTSPSPDAPSIYGIFVTTSSFTDICYVSGISATSTNIVRFGFDGGGNDAVVSGVADIIVNHNKDVYVQTQGGAYNPFQLRIKPTLSSPGGSPTGSTQGTYVLQFKLGPSYSAATGRIYVTAASLDSSTIVSYTVPGGLSYSDIEHTHTCRPGMHISSTDGDGGSIENAKLNINGGIALASGLSNNSARPALNQYFLSHGEIRGYSSALDVQGNDGFLRLSAGGGLNTSSKAYIDITGYSNVYDMNCNVVLGTGGLERMRILNTGQVGIGTTTPTEKLDVSGSARFRSIGSTISAGALHYTADGTLTTNTSDERLKTNIQPLTGSLDKVNQLRGVTYNWITESTGSVRVGFVAQEVASIVPELTFTNPNSPENYMGVHYDNVTALLVEAVKELSAENATLKSEIQAIKTHLGL